MSRRVSTYEDEINQAIDRLTEIFPSAEHSAVTEAVTCAASLTGEAAYDILVEQAVAIYLESVEPEASCSLNQNLTWERNAASTSQLFHQQSFEQSDSSSLHGCEIRSSPSKYVPPITEQHEAKSTDEETLSHLPGPSRVSRQPSPEKSSPDVDKFYGELNSSVSKFESKSSTVQLGKGSPQELKGQHSTADEAEHGFSTHADRNNPLPDYEDLLGSEVNPDLSRIRTKVKEDCEEQNVEAAHKDMFGLSQFLPTTSHEMSHFDRSPMKNGVAPPVHDPQQLNISLRYPAENSDSCASRNKSESCSEVHVNVASASNTAPSSSVPKTQAGSRETSIGLKKSSSVSETCTSDTGKRAHSEIDSEFSPPCVPNKKANLEAKTKSSELSSDEEWPVLVSCKTLSTPRKRAQAGLSQKFSSEKKVDIIDLTDDMDVTDSAFPPFPSAERKPDVGTLQRELLLRFSDPGPSMTVAACKADSTQSYLQMSTKNNLTPQLITSEKSSSYPHPPAAATAPAPASSQTPTAPSDKSTQKTAALVQRPGTSTGSATQTPGAVSLVGLSPFPALQQLRAGDPGALRLSGETSRSQETAWPRGHHSSQAAPQLSASTQMMIRISQHLMDLAHKQSQQSEILFPSTSKQTGSSTAGTAKKTRILPPDTAKKKPRRAQKNIAPTPGTSQQTWSPHLVMSHQIRAPVPELTQQLNTPTPHTSQGLNTPTPHISQQLNTPTPHTSQGLNTPTPHISQQLNTPTTHTSQQLNTPTPHISHRLNTPTPHISQGLNTPTPHISQRLNTPTPHISQWLNTPTPHISHRLNTPTPHISQRLNAPTPHTSQRLNSPTPHTSQRLNAPTPHTSQGLRAASTHAMLLPKSPVERKHSALQEHPSEALKQNIAFSSSTGSPVLSENTEKSSHTSKSATSYVLPTPIPGTLQQVNINLTQILGTQSHEVNALSQVSHGSVQSQTGSYPMKISSCESVGISEPSSSLVRNIKSKDQVGENSSKSQGLLEPSSTGGANQESKQSNLPMLDVLLGQNVSLNYFGNRHLKSVANYLCGKMSESSPGQGLNAVMSTMNKLLLMSDGSQLHSAAQARGVNLASQPLLQQSSSNCKDLQGKDLPVKDEPAGQTSLVSNKAANSDRLLANEASEMDVDSIPSTSGTSKIVKKKASAKGYRNHREVDMDEDSSHSGAGDLQVDGGALTWDSDILECSACSTSSAVHKCVSCYTGHFLCKSCVEEEIQSVMLSKSKMSLLCTAKSCQEQLDLASLEHIVDAFVLGLLRKNIQQKEMEASSSAIKKMTGYVSCPSCSYSGLMEFDDFEFVCGNNNCTVRCCRYCKSKWTNRLEHLGCYLLSFVGTECFQDISVLPLNWKKKDKAVNDFQVKIKLNTVEGAGWSEYFKLTNPRMTVVAMWRVQNKKLWERYVVKRKHMAEELGFENIQEKALFHGTKYDNIKIICNEGFDFRVQAANGSSLGRGIYFSKLAAYSQKFSCRKKHMFIARVLCGQSVAGNQWLTRPPHSASGRLYDSCVDDIISPTMYSVFDNTQCYPEILLQFN